MPDRAFKKELDVFPVVCYHKTDRNCSWTNVLSMYQVRIFLNIIFNIIILFNH